MTTVIHLQKRMRKHLMRKAIETTKPEMVNLFFIFSTMKFQMKFDLNNAGF